MLPIFDRPLTDAQGNLKPFGTVVVTRESNGAAATIYSDNTGTILSLSGQFQAGTDGLARFWLTPDLYQIVVSASGFTETYPNVFVPPLNRPIVTASSSRSMNAVDIGNVIVTTNGSGFTYNVDDDDIHPGQSVHFRQFGAGAITINNDADSIQAPNGGTLVSAGQGATMTLYRSESDQLILMGHTAAA